MNDIYKLYFELQESFKIINQNQEKKTYVFSGDLKDGKNTLKVSGLKAEIVSKLIFEEEMKQVKAIYDSLILPNNRNKLFAEAEKGLRLYNDIENSDFKINQSSPFVYDDKADIVFKLKNEKDEVIHTYPTIKVRTYGQFKINGSAGYFINFIGDDVYETFKLDESNKNYLRKSSRSFIKNGLGGLLHGYYTCSPTFGFGLSVGLSLSENANAGYYFGGSLLLTEKNRLVITGGVSFTKVDRLNTSGLSFKDNTYYFTEENYQIQYNLVYRPAFFMGISYNLFN